MSTHLRLPLTLSNTLSLKLKLKKRCRLSQPRVQHALFEQPVALSHLFHLLLALSQRFHLILPIYARSLGLPIHVPTKYFARSLHYYSEIALIMPPLPPNLPSPLLPPFSS